jgi:hypothetical protein
MSIFGRWAKIANFPHKVDVSELKESIDHFGSRASVNQRHTFILLIPSFRTGSQTNI